MGLPVHLDFQWIGHPQIDSCSHWQLHGSSCSFTFTEIKDLCVIPIDAILIFADPRAKRDCIYTQSKKEVIATSEYCLERTMK